MCAFRSLVSQPRGDVRMIHLKSHTRMPKNIMVHRRAIVAAVKRAQGRLRSPIKTGRKGPLFSRQLRHLIQQTSISPRKRQHGFSQRYNRIFCYSINSIASLCIFIYCLLIYSINIALCVSISLQERR